MRNFWKSAGSMALAALGTKVISELLKKCNKESTCPDPKKTVDVSNARFIPNQLVVWKRPGISDDTFARWKRDNLRQSGIKQIKLCAFCDDSLELWQGDNVSTFISGKGATAGNSAGGGGLTGGGDDIACYSYNLIIDLPEPQACVHENDAKRIQLPRQAQSAEPPVIVAVFDTGLDPVIKSAYTSPVFSCMPGGELGWNFCDKNNNTDDDYPSKHGSRVSMFIINQAIKYRNQRINILPVKVHNKFGKSNLFSILCGFAYAANCGAKIINASFGFYDSLNSAPPTILAEFVKKHLTDRNILLVAAAGNVNADHSLTNNENDAIRNLDLNPFFPACLAKNFMNVLAVTTTSLVKDAVSPSQNFSKTIVDIGVKCDKEISDDYRFEDPLNATGGSDEFYILGSSFATPVVTGLIAQHYPAVLSSMINGSINKNNLIKTLKQNDPTLVVSESNPIEDLIREGNCCAK